MVSIDCDFLDPDYDEFSTSTTRSVTCCRSVAIIFMVLLILRHTLPVMINGAEYTFPLFMLILLQTAGIILSIYFMLRAVTAIQQRRHWQFPTPVIKHFIWKGNLGSENTDTSGE